MLRQHDTTGRPCQGGLFTCRKTKGPGMPITTPDAFLGQPLLWIGNQSAHALIVGIGVFALAAITPLTRREAFLATLALYGVWEVWTFAGDFLDAATDWSFVAMGAAFGWMAWEGDRDKMALAFTGIVVAGAAGVWVRL